MKIIKRRIRGVEGSRVQVAGNQRPETINQKLIVAKRQRHTGTEWALKPRRTRRARRI